MVEDGAVADFLWPLESTVMGVTATPKVESEACLKRLLLEVTKEGTTLEGLNSVSSCSASAEPCSKVS